MKWPAVVCILLQVVLSGLYCAAFYWLGYEETVVAQSATDPSLPLLVTGILSAVVFVLLIRSFHQGENRVWMSCMAFVFALVSFVPMGMNWIHRPLLAMGLRDRLLHDAGPGLDDLRTFAREATRDLHPHGLDHGHYALKGNFTFLPLTQQGQYDQLRQHYPFLKFRGDGSSGPTVSFHGDVIDVQWGDVNGNWGFSVAVQGGSNVSLADPGTSILQAGDDIYFYAN